MLRTKVDYASFKGEINKLKIPIEDEKWIEMKPFTKIIQEETEHQKEITERMVRVTIIDETVSYKEAFDVTRDQLNDIVKVLNELKYQLKYDTGKSKSE